MTWKLIQISQCKKGEIYYSGLVHLVTNQFHIDIHEHYSPHPEVEQFLDIHTLEHMLLFQRYDDGVTWNV